jgi:hypothetical protein
MSDNLNGIFNHLSPADFNQITSAIHAEVQPAPPIDPFAQFVHEQLVAVRYAFAAADGAINPVATLTSSSVQRFFAPEDDESLNQYAARLAREARVVQARWLFISRKTEVGTFVGKEAVAADDPVALATAREQGQTMEAVYWYAERLDGEPTRRHGFLMIVGNHLGELVEVEAAQVVNLIGGILGGGSASDVS